MDQQTIKKTRIALRIFKDLAAAKIAASGGRIDQKEAYSHFLGAIEEARSPRGRATTRDKHGRLIRNLIDAIEEIVGRLFSKDFVISGESKRRIAFLMQALDEAILIHPFGKEIKLIPNTALLSDSVLPVFMHAAKAAETNRNEAWLSLMDVEARIYKFREEAERERLGNLELVYPIVRHLEERSCPQPVHC